VKSRRPDVPKTVRNRLRKACLALPEVHEEQAWAGTRWRIRKETFAHALVGRILGANVDWRDIPES
jgi:hypothetical protein